MSRSKGFKGQDLMVSNCGGLKVNALGSQDFRQKRGQMCWNIQVGKILILKKVSENIDIDKNIVENSEIAKILFGILLSLRKVWNISILIREFFKMSISMKY